MKFKEGCFYEKTIKLIGIVLAMILAIMQFSTISYGTSIDQGAMGGPSIGIDNTPPNIVSVSLDKNMVKPGETSKFDFEVEDIGQDTIPPVVSNVKRITDTVTAPGEFIVQFDVTDNKSGVANMGIGFGYSPANDLSGVHFANAEKIGENTYQAKVKVESPYSKFVVVAKKQISEQVKS